MAEAVVEANNSHIQGRYDWWKVGLVGAVTGVLVVVVAALLERYVVDFLLCRGDTLEACAQSGVLSANLAAVVGAMMGFVLLLRLGVYRAVAVVVAVLVAFWGIASLFDGLRPAEVFAWMAGLYTLTYLLFVNIFRIRALIVAAVATIFVIVIVRWAAFI